MAVERTGIIRLALDAFGNVTAVPSQRVLRWMSGRRVAEIGAALLLIVASAFQMIDQSAQVQGVVDATTPAAAAARYDEVYERLAVAGLDINERGVASLVSSVAGTISIATEPAGAQVSVTRIQPITSWTSRRPTDLGRSPLDARPLVAGQYLVRLSSPGLETVELVVTAEVGKDVRISRTMLPEAESAVHDAVVFVDSGMTRVVAGTPVPAFVIGKYEVTNAQYQEFVDAGGYLDTTLWPATMISRGRRLPRVMVLRTLVDATNEFGPRYWSDGTYPEGEDDHPVIGISWYEASAFAAWAGLALPTRAQWYRAAIGERQLFPWGYDPSHAEDRANFGLVGTLAVGSFPLGISPFGCYDMAGNAREWLADSLPAGRRIAAGGSWQEGLSSFDARHAEALDPAFRGRATGVRLVMPAEPREP